MLRHWFISLLFASLFSTSLYANTQFSQDLESLTNQLTQLNTQLKQFSFTNQSDCLELGTLNTSIEDYLLVLENIYQQITSPLSLTADDLTNLETMSSLTLTMAQESMRLSWELRSIDDVFELFEYQSALSAMLRLSDDIGTMADRILEMADRILIQADNINLMADRIIQTQRIQYTNMAILQTSLLTTQENIIAMSDSLSSIVYNLTLKQLKIDNEDLNEHMGQITLSTNNMADELDLLANMTNGIFNQTTEVSIWLIENSVKLSHHINSDTLTLMGDLTNIHTALALSLEAYSETIQQLAQHTDNETLKASINAMLRLTADIGKMSNRIMEMSNKIMIMADNIGVMSTKIIETEQLMLTNLQIIQSSLTTAQNISINLLKTSAQ